MPSASSSQGGGWHRGLGRPMATTNGNRKAPTSRMGQTLTTKKASSSLLDHVHTYKQEGKKGEKEAFVISILGRPCQYILLETPSTLVWELVELLFVIIVIIMYMGLSQPLNFECFPKFKP